MTQPMNPMDLFLLALPLLLAQAAIPLAFVAGRRRAQPEDPARPGPLRAALAVMYSPDGRRADWGPRLATVSMTGFCLVLLLIAARLTTTGSAGAAQAAMAAEWVMLAAGAASTAWGGTASATRGIPSVADGGDA